MPNFWGPKKDKKVINSSTKCLISVKIAVLTSHIIPPPLVNIWLIFDLQKYVKWLGMFLEVNPCFLKSPRLLYGSTASCRSIQCCMYVLYRLPRLHIQNTNKNKTKARFNTKYDWTLIIVLIFCIIHHRETYQLVTHDSWPYSQPKHFKIL